MKLLSLFALMGGLLLAQSGFSDDKYPDVTTDGLSRAESKKLDAVYWLPEANLTGYTKIMIADCEVSFRKHWQRDQNRDRRLSERVDAKDMDRIRLDMAKRFKEIFTTALEEEGAFEIVDSIGDDVLLLQPKIVDLDLYAPDVNAPTRTRFFTTSAGRMTLEMNLKDSSTQAVIGRVIDRRRAREDSVAQIANSVTNRVEMDRVMRRWARILSDSLDAAD